MARNSGRLKPIKPTGSRDLTKFQAKATRDLSPVEAKLLEVIADGWSVSKAAAAAGIARRTAFNWRDDAKTQRDALDPKAPDFREKWDANFFTRWEDAMEAGVDKYEDEAGRRATGYDEPVFGKDGEIGRKQLYSDPLMMMIMKGKRPDRYGIDRKEISGPNGQPIPHSVEIEFVAPAKKGKKP
jgi:hypothetical protein